jgi:hypothetical protein
MQFHTIGFGIAHLGNFLSTLDNITLSYKVFTVMCIDGDVIIVVLSFLGRFISPLADKAELARIGRYYATESMLVWNAAQDRYDADATPSTGRETLWDCYQDLVRGKTSLERGDHAVF